jgi:transcriptional regulator of arginine metabolism
VTQATLSRDLDEIGAAKVPSADGGQVYAVPEDGSVRVLRAPGSTAPSARLVHMLEELLVEADGAHNLALLKTLPGGAPLLASAIDHAQLPGVLGTVAGDDTVLLACREERGGPVVAERLRLLAAGRRTHDPDPAAPPADPGVPGTNRDQETTQ